MSRIRRRLMKFLKDGEVIAPGLSVEVRKPRLQSLFPRAIKEKFRNLYLILMVEFLVP